MWFTSKEKNKEQADQLMAQARKEREKENILAALDLLEKAIRLDKEYATPYGEYGIALAQQKNNFDIAEYNGQFAIIKDSKNPIQWRNMAHNYYLLGSYPHAYVSILVAEYLNPHFENLPKLKSLIKGILSKDHLQEMDMIEEQTKQTYNKYSLQPVIMPEPFFEEALSFWKAQR